MFKSNFILKPETDSINLKQIRKTKFVKIETIKLDLQKRNPISYSQHCFTNSQFRILTFSRFFFPLTERLCSVLDQVNNHTLNVSYLVKNDSVSQWCPRQDWTNPIILTLHTSPKSLKFQTLKRVEISVLGTPLEKCAMWVWFQIISCHAHLFGFEHC